MKKILVGISGASGAPIAIRLLKRLREMADVETHLIMTKGAELTIVQETDCTVEQVKALADVVYDVSSLGECPASGSFNGRNDHCSMFNENSCGNCFRLQ